MFSYHLTKSTGKNASHFTPGWLVEKRESPSFVTEVITKNAISACLYNGGYRAAKNFICADLCILDFDKGLTVKEAVVLFSEYRCLIAASKSHQKNKDGVTCDRFRVVLWFDDVIDDASDFVFTMKTYIKNFGSDASACDAGRFYFPCTEVLHYHDGWFLPKLVYIKPQHKNVKRREDELGRPTKRMIEFECSGAFDVGTRHETILRVASECAFVGYTLEETFAFILPRTNKEESYLERDITEGYKWGLSKKLERKNPTDG